MSASMSESRAVHRAAHGLEQRGLLRITHRAMGTRAQVFLRLTDRGREVISQQPDDSANP
jgi:DNA-binding MarR family transcriptional regulator